MIYTLDQKSLSIQKVNNKWYDLMQFYLKFEELFQNGFATVKFAATVNTVSTRLRGAQKALTG